MASGSRFGRPFAVLKNRPKAFCEGNRVGSITGAKKTHFAGGKVFSGRNGEYLGSVGPLWRHMVKVENFENSEVFDPPGGPLGCAWGTPKMLLILSHIV